jgi:hypothetical protein
VVATVAAPAAAAAVALPLELAPEFAELALLATVEAELAAEVVAA